MRHFIPDSVKHAESVLSTTMSWNPAPQFSALEPLLKIWNCIAYLHAGLHPDEIESPDGGWPNQYLLYAKEVWKRHEKGEVTDDALYPSDAQWAGLCDQLSSLSNEESQRRHQLHESMGDAPFVGGGVKRV
jgi:hypothetical protein